MSETSPWAKLQFRPRPLIVLIGDSITQLGNDVSWGGCFGKDGPGWASAIQDAYQRRADVINRGYSGYNTDWVLHLLPDILDGLPLPKGGHVVLFTILLGANDAVAGEWADDQGRPVKTQHVPLHRYTENLKRIVAMLWEHQPMAKIVIISPPKVSNQDRPMLLDGRPDTRRDEALTQKYAAASAQVANDLGVHLLDLYSHMETLPNWRALLCDGLHLSGEGQKELANQLMKLIRTQMPELAPNEDDSGLARDAPHHSKFAE